MTADCRLPGHVRVSLPPDSPLLPLALAALRAAGGQEEPRAGNGVFGPDGETQPTDYRAPVGGQAEGLCSFCGGEWRHRDDCADPTVRPPWRGVGGQAEPSDDIVHDCPNCSHELVGDHDFHGCAVFGCACRVSGGAAAVSGEHQDATEDAQ